MGNNFQKKEVLALIPARGGSKRIPRKNIRPLWGKPLLAYSIETALQSKMINRVICTTDDQEIADIALNYGADVPFLRPKKIAGDHSADTEFYLHALSWLAENENYRPDIIANLRPTNPLRRVEVVDDVLKTLKERPDVDSIRTVSKSTLSPYKMRLVDPETGLIKPLVFITREGPYNRAKLPLPETFLLNSYLDATWVNVVMDRKLSLGENMLAYILDEDPIDIDTEEDWQRLLREFPSFEAYLSQEIQAKISE
jgi:CMP-N,N'-diacetyllegionaminic acid synthase